MMFSVETLVCIICLSVCCNDNTEKLKEINKKLDRIEEKLERLKME